MGNIFATDLHKLDGWKTLSSQPSLPEWLGSDSEEDEEEEGSESEESGSEETESD